MKNIAILCLLMLSFYASIDAQNTKHYSLLISPSTSWFTTDDNQINSNGGLFNARITAKMEKPLKGNLYYSKGIGMAFGQGGTLRHEIGGNLLPASDLDNPEWNSGTRPLVDGTDIEYKIRMLEIPLGLKYKIPTSGYSTYFVELPFTTHIKVNTKGAISNSTVDAANQNIGRDVHLVNWTWGIGGGVEYGINPDFSLIAGISFHRTLFDQLKNNGFKTVTNAEGQLGESIREKSKAKLNMIQFNFGIIF